MSAESSLMDAVSVSKISEASEREQLLRGWNATDVPLPCACIQELFEAQVQRSPEAIALVFGEQQLSYQQLNEQANRLAQHLRSLGVGPDRLVALCLERSLEIVVAILATLKAGGAYVPLDPQYPLERLSYMLTDSSPAVLLVHEATRSLKLDVPPDTQRLDLQADAPGWLSLSGENLDPRSLGLRPESLAYIIYTSGSTGLPKGVMIEHRNAVHLSVAQGLSLGVDARSRIVQFASFSFDACVWEILLAFCQGASLHVPERGLILTGQTLTGFLDRHQITHATLPPAVLSRLAASATLSSVTTLIAAGEALPSSLVQRWAAHRRLINAYGPTEATVCATMAECDAEAGTAPPIGRPIANTRIYILDEQGEPVPVGVSGEIYIGGAGVARGYLNREALTAERFLTDPFSPHPNARMYRSGDLGRWRADGNIEYLGRNDFQVKIRGFRIELGEIEARLREYPGVQEAIVLAREDAPGEKRLVAYFTHSPEQIPSEGWSAALRTHLLASLPEYMVPPAYVPLESLPLTVNGKLDRKALPAPEADAFAQRLYEEPRGEIEWQLARIWSEVLKLDRVGRHDNFFELGGNSLLANEIAEQIRSATGHNVPMRAFFQNPTIAASPKYIEDHSTSTPVTSLPANEPAFASTVYVPLTHSQKRVWFLSQLQPDSSAYHAQATIEFRGELKLEVLKECLNDLVMRHEALRSAVAVIGDQVVQVIASYSPPNISYFNFEVLAEEQREAELELLIRSAAKQAFNLTRPPLVHWSIVRINFRKHILVHTEHHLIHDGYSFTILLSELTRLYQARVSKAPEDTLSPPHYQYSAFANYEQRWLTSSLADAQLKYWAARLRGASSELTLARARVPADSSDRTAQYLKFSLPIELARNLRRFSAANGTTLFVAMFSAFIAVLHRYSGQSDISVGTGIANRRHPFSKGTVGMFVNTLVLRCAVSDNATFSELLRHAQDVVIDASDNQELPFDKVVEHLSPVRRPSVNPFFETLFSFHDSRFDGVSLPGLELLANEGLATGQAKFDLNVVVIPRSVWRSGIDGGADPEEILVSWEYRAGRFDHSYMQNLARHFEACLAAMVASPQQRIDRLPLLDTHEREQLLRGWNATDVPLPCACIQELFEAQVQRSPEAIALVFGEQQLSYQQLNEQANRLAQHLRSLGVGPDRLVALCLERSLEMVVAILATLKAGGAYVPLDPQYPLERLSYMLTDSSPAVLLVHEATRSLKLDVPPDTQRLDLQADAPGWLSLSGENLDPRSLGLRPESLAYIIYTSGSTGLPKGVMIEHRSKINHLLAMNRTLTLAPLDVVAQTASACFDISVWQFLSALIVGARVHIVPDAIAKEPASLTSLVRSAGITILQVVPTMLATIVENKNCAEALKSLRHLLVTGEAFLAGLQRAWAAINPTVPTINAYGPAECSDDVTFYLRQSDPQDTYVPIGRPIANTRIYILDEQGEPVPVGVSGEIYIGGAGVARGYLNREALTAERFLTDPFSPHPNARMYRSGDLGRWRADGNIEYLGRNDFQVKIRGFRIELGEIEARLREYPGVQEAIVLAREDAPGEKRLVAYFTHSPEQIPSEGWSAALRTHLLASLPEYMVPPAYVPLESLPLTVNGKLDRKALPAPEADAFAQRLYEEPRGEIEWQLARVWSEVLKLDRVGRHDNFFELGGHSLLAVTVIERMRLAGLHADVRDFVSHSSIAKLSEVVSHGYKNANVDQAVPIRLKGHQRPLFLIHCGAGELLYASILANYLSEGLPIYGLPAERASDLNAINLPAMAERLTKMMRSTQPSGPYRLAGWSFGGKLAYEVARQLLEKGDAVEFLGMIDTLAGDRDISDIDDSKWLLSMIDIDSHAKTALEIETSMLTFEQLVNTCRQQTYLPALFRHFSAHELSTHIKRQRVLHQASAQYQIKPLPIVVHLFTATEDGVDDRGWSLHTNGGGALNIVPVEGTHDNMCSPPQVQTLGAIISASLYAQNLT